MFLLSHNQVYGSGQEKEAVDDRWGVSPRYILQRVGTNLMRDQLAAAAPELSMGKDATLWVRCFRLWLGRFNTPQKVVVPDVRFEDEAAFIRELGGTLIRIVRPTGGGGWGGTRTPASRPTRTSKWIRRSSMTSPSCSWRWGCCTMRAV